jgi:ribosome biogenesis GTPase A
MAAIEDQLVVEEDEQHGREQVETDLVKYLKDKLVQFHAKISSYGTNVATARGIQKLSSEFEILVFGPARVGKSTLIKQVSGDETIITSAKLNACTSVSEKYIDKYNIHWWDTPGMFCIVNQLHIFKLNF